MDTTGLSLAFGWLWPGFRLRRHGRAVALLAAALAALGATTAPREARAATPNFDTYCTSCHATPPEGPRLNAGNASAVITTANTNHSMSLGAAALAAVGTIATEIGTLLSGPQAISVGYHTAGNAVTIQDLFNDAPNAVITTTTTIASPSAGTLGGVGTAGSFGVTYSHTGATCGTNVDSFRVAGTGAATTAGRLVNVTVTAPTVTASNITVGAIAYSTSATPINISSAISVSGVSSSATGTLQLSGQTGVGTTAGTGPTTLSYTATGTTYSPTVTVNYQAQGPCSTTSATRTVTIPVTAPPAPTSSNLGPVTVPAGAGVTTAIPVVLSGYVSANPLTVVAQPPAGQGTVAVTGPSQFTYTASGYTGTTTFTFNATGPSGAVSATYTVTLSPTAAPVVSATSRTTAYNTAIAIDLSASIAGTVTSVTPSSPVGGTALATGPTTITFTPTAGFIGTGSFQFTATGPGGTSPSAATVTVTVNPPPPTVAPASVTVAFNSGNPVTSATIDLAPYITGVVASVSATGAVNGGTSVLGTVVTFTPTLGYVGPASFSYTATNPGGTSAPATVSITVSPPPPPVAASLTVLVSATQPTQIDLAASITGSYSSVSIFSPPTAGTVSLAGTMATYTPLAGFTETATFMYRATGLGGPSAPATVTLVYTAAPVTSSRSMVVPYNTAGSIDLTSAFSGIVTSYSISKAPAHGTVSVNGPYVTYTPNKDYFGPDSFQFTATGPGGPSVPGTVSVTVSPPAPVASHLDVKVPFDTPTAIDLGAAAGGAATSFRIIQAPAHGTVVVSGSIATYTPARGYGGEDIFTYVAINATGTSAPAEVHILVASVAPTAATASLSVPTNGSGTIDLAPYITGSNITGVSISVLPAHGLADVNGTKVTYTPKTNYFGSDTFTYVAYGNAGTSRAVVVSVAVVGRPDPSQDAAVTGLVRGQADAARRFSRAQIGNFQRRLESLHVGPPNEAPATSQAPSKPGAPVAAASRGNPARADDPFGPLPGANGVAPASITAPGAAPKVASAGSLQGMLAQTLVAAAASKSVDAGAVAGGPAPAPGMQPGSNVWMGGIAQFGKRGAGESGSDLSFSTDGLSVGFDRRFNANLALGMGMGYARDKTDVGTDGSRTKASGTSFAGYGSYQPTRNTFVDALVGYGRLDYENARYVPSVEEFATGKRKGDQFFASIAAGYELRREGVLLSPYGRLDFTADKLKQWTESGAGANALTYYDQTIRNTQGAAGLRVETRHETDFGWTVPRMRLEYRYDFNDAPSASISYADLFGGTVYSVTPAGTSRSALLFGVGADFLWRKGTRLAIDYQGERTSGPGTAQSIRFLLSQDLDARLPFSPGRWSWKPMNDPVGVEAGFTYDDNVSRGRLSSEKLSDQVYSLGLNASRTFPLTNNSRAVATALLSVDKFHDNTGLGRTSGGLQGELQYRASGDFDSITYALFARAWIDGYESKLRSGTRMSAGANARRSLTDRIDVFGEIGANWRRAESDVFGGRDYAAKLNLDYSLGPAGTAYLAGEYRRGDTFASGLPSLENLNLADVFVRDDAFENRNFFAYRFEAQTLLGTVGYNRPLGPRDSIDFSYRYVRTTPLTRPDTGPSSYNVNQYSILYLLRF